MKQLITPIFIFLILLTICNSVHGQDQHKIEFDGKTFSQMHSALTPDGGIIFCARQYIRFKSGNILLIKFDRFNKLTWIKEMDSRIEDINVPNKFNIDNNISALSAMPDNGFIVTTYGSTRGVIMRYNSRGELQWAKSFYKKDDWDEIRPEAIEVVSDEIFIAGSIGSAPEGYTWHFISSLSFSGEVNSFKIFNKSDSVYFIRQIIHDEQGNIFIATDNKNIISLIDINSGRVYSLRANNFPPILRSKIALTKDSILITGFADRGYGFFALKVSKDLKAGIPDICFVNPAGPEGHSGFIFEPYKDDAVYLAGTAPDLPALYKIAPFEEKVHWGWKYGGSERVYISQLHVNKKEVIVATGLYNPGILTGGSPYMLNSDSLGQGCIDSSLSLTFKRRQFTTIRGTASLLNHDFGLVDRKVNVTSVSLGTVEPLCYGLPPSARIDLSDSIICAGEEITFINNTIRGEKWRWSFEGTSIDTFIGEKPPPLVYYTPGIYNIIMITENWLGTSYTSRKIEVHEKPHAIVSPDTFFCSEAPAIPLKASGGETYRWYTSQQSTLSTDPVYYVSPDISSTFYVEIKNKAGCSDIDAINVEAFHRPLDQGFDTTICIGDKIRLKADSGNFSYEWSDGKTQDNIEVLKQVSIT